MTIERSDEGSRSQTDAWCQEATKSPSAATTMTENASQPSTASVRELTASPMTIRSLVSRSTIKISGGASTPLMTAVVKSSLIAVNPA